MVEQWVLPRSHQNLIENLRSLSRYHRACVQLISPVLLLYNASQLGHHHPDYHNFPAHLPRYNACSTLAPYVPLHRKQRSLRVGDIYQVPLLQYEQIFYRLCYGSNPIHSLQIKLDDVPALIHLLHQEELALLLQTLNSRYRQFSSALLYSRG